MMTVMSMNATIGLTQKTANSWLFSNLYCQKRALSPNGSECDLPTNKLAQLTTVVLYDRPTASGSVNEGVVVVTL